MSFNVNSFGGYGTGKLGDISISDGLFDKANSYVRITAIDELDDNKVSFDTDNVIEGNFESFVAGVEILLHVSTSSTETEYLGKFMTATILLVNNGILTLSRPFTDLLPRDQFDFYAVQAVTFANADCLTLNESGILAPIPFDPHKLCGGILCLKCYDSLFLKGGHIDLADKGIPANWKNLLRPITRQETPARGEGDVAQFAGQENFTTAERFLLNAGDGALFCLAKNIHFVETSRIGNTKTHGVRHCRGAYNSIGSLPDGVTNVGGSSILIAAETIYSFNHKCIAKYRNADSYEGRGLARCFIASNTNLPLDEGLYSFDCLSNYNRLKDVIGVRDFGNGSFGTLTNPNKPLNNYAQIVGITRNGAKLTFGRETVKGLAPIIEDALLLIQVIPTGQFVISKVLWRGDNSCVIDFPAPLVNLKKFRMQAISIPQFTDFTLNVNYTLTPKFNGAFGGVCAIAANGTMDLRNGKINVEKKGGAKPYGYEGLSTMGNSQAHSTLPLGQGHGSVFLLTNYLLLNENSRIGATYSGLGGETFGGNNSTGSNRGGGFAPAFDEDNSGYGGGFHFGGASNLDTKKHRYYAIPVGGIGSNGQDFNGFKGGLQGAHIFTVANVITNFTQAAFSTGGSGGNGFVSNGLPGASGYGGGSATNGGSGGSSGSFFLYSN